MAEQVRKQRSKKESTKEEVSADQLPHAEHKSPEELKAEMDDLLDEIDDVLEKNAKEFVENYVQKGGE